MAKNLRQKLPTTTTIYINDAVESVAIGFKDEFQSFGPIVLCTNAAHVIENSVGGGDDERSWQVLIVAGLPHLHRPGGSTRLRSLRNH
jgi:hypothetical protein